MLDAPSSLGSRTDRRRADQIAKAGAQGASPARLITPKRQRVITHNNRLQGVDSPDYTEGAGTASNWNWRSQKTISPQRHRRHGGDQKKGWSRSRRWILVPASRFKQRSDNATIKKRHLTSRISIVKPVAKLDVDLPRVVPVEAAEGQTVVDQMAVGHVQRIHRSRKPVAELLPQRKIEGGVLGQVVRGWVGQTQRIPSRSTGWWQQTRATEG